MFLSTQLLNGSEANFCLIFPLNVYNRLALFFTLHRPKTTYSRRQTSCSYLKERERKSVKGPLVLVIMDGVGIYNGMRDGYFGNAFDIAYTPNLDAQFAITPLYTIAQGARNGGRPASDADMGTAKSATTRLARAEIMRQGAKLVNSAIETRGLFNGKTWMEDVGSAQNHRPCGSRRGLPPRVKIRGCSPRTRPPRFIFIGLLSDGNVNSHIDTSNSHVARMRRGRRSRRYSFHGAA
jgi:hypothetical protein